MSDSKLVGTGNVGDFVLSGQGHAGDKGFPNVSPIWFNKTITIDEGIDQIEDEKRLREDIECPAKHMRVKLNDENQIAFEYIDGREFVPTEYALKRVASWYDQVPHGVIKRLSNPALKQNGNTDYNRDRQDAETLLTVFKNGERRVDPNKKFRYRTYNDGTLRAMLSETYAPIDNVWYLELIKTLMPEARLSHWRGDADTLFGNILIPHSIRKEQDSEYGGMLSIGNCEIGKRRLEQYPSLFRAICMNGCIWDQTKGNVLSQVHRGSIDLGNLESKILANIAKQIPLINQSIEDFLKLREFGMKKEDSLTGLLAVIAKSNNMTSGKASSQLVAIADEYSTHEKADRNLFGIINAVTRAGQRDGFTREDWLSFDMIGGKLAKLSKNKWEHLISQGNNLDSKVVKKMYGLAV